MSHAILLDRVEKRFDAVAAVREVTLEVQAGEFFSFLGPSGCGKTTILRLVGGFIEPSAGRILIGGADMRGLGPNKRPTAMIFQNLALFPLMSVADNIAFGLEVRGVPRAERHRRAEALLDLIALPGYGGRAVAELSGGQKQRVAIARALAVEPTVLLLDEPLSALDLKLRQHMRAELRAIQRRTGVTFVYITHDQSEALAMSDRVAVMSQGRVEQIGVPEEIYERPATAFVAGFVGEANRFGGRVSRLADGLAEVETALGPLRGRAGPGLSPGDAATVFVRPERIAVAPEGLAARICGRSFEGPVLALVAEAAGAEIVVHIANHGDLPPLEPGAAIHLAFEPRHAMVFGADADA